MAIFTGNGSSNTISGTGSADTLFGRGGNDTLRGNGGDDRIFGESGNDRLFGGRGNDSMFGGSGDDFLKAEWGNDTLYGDSGNDTLFGDVDNDRLFGGDGDDQLYGGEGNDRMEGGNGDDTYHSSGLANGSIAGDVIIDHAGIDTLFFYAVGVTLPDGIENLVLRPVSDFVDAKGNSLSNVIHNESSQTGFLDGAEGDDQLIGGSGTDIIALSAGNDSVDGGAGRDWLIGGSANFRTGIADLFDGTTTFRNIDVAEGGLGSDQMIADDAGREIHGSAGDDTITGGAGADMLFGDGGFEHPDTLLGNDIVTGGAGDDFLQGGAGMDTLDGGPGNDSLRGESEPFEYADRFVFSAAPGSANSDRILDFDELDELVFDNATFTALGAESAWGSDDARFHSADGAISAQDPSDRLIYDTSAGDLYYDADGAGGGGASIVATLESAPGLTSSDITVI